MGGDFNCTLIEKKLFPPGTSGIDPDAKKSGALAFVGSGTPQGNLEPYAGGKIWKECDDETGNAPPGCDMIKTCRADGTCVTQVKNPAAYQGFSNKIIMNADQCGQYKDTKLCT